MAEIKLVLIGQIYNSEGGYAYISDNATSSEEWLKGVDNLDPRNVRDYISLVRQEIPTYSFWQTDMGWYYGISAFNPNDSRMGHAMVVLFLGHHVPSDGQYWTTKMKTLLDIFISTENKSRVDNSQINEVVKDLQGYLVESYSSTPVFSTNKTAETAYYLYDTTDDLSVMLQYPKQQQFSKFLRLFILPKENVKEDKTHIWKNINNIVVRYYNIINPDKTHIFVNQSAVQQGDTLNITYKKEEVGETSISVKVEPNSQYYNLSALTLTLKPLKVIDSIISFSKKLTFVVKSKSGKPINNFKLSINGGQSYSPQANANTITFTLKNGKTKVSVSATGYKRFEEIIDTTESKYLNNTLIPIELEPTIEKISLKVRYDGNEYSGEVCVSSDNDLYFPLKNLQNYVLGRPKKDKFFSKKNLILILIILLLSLAIGGFVGYFVGAKITESQYVELKGILEDHDKKYLRENSKWKRSHLQSPMYIDIFDKIKKGEHVYLHKNFNTTYTDVARLLDSLKRYDANAPKEMLAVNNDEINLDELKIDIPKRITGILVKNDSTFLVSNDIWKVQMIKSQKYKDFMVGMEDGNVQGLRKHNELDSNETWREICRLMTKDGAKRVVKANYKNGEVNLSMLKNDLSKLGQGSGTIRTAATTVYPGGSSTEGSELPTERKKGRRRR